MTIFIVWQAAIVDVEIGIEDGLALRAKKGRLRLEPPHRSMESRPASNGSNPSRNTGAG